MKPLPVCRPATSFTSVRQHPSVAHLREAFTELLCNCLDLLRTDRLATVDTSCCTDDTNNNGTIDRGELAGLSVATDRIAFQTSIASTIDALTQGDPVRTAAFTEQSGANRAPRPCR